MPQGHTPSEMLFLSSRQDLQAVLGRYATNTLNHINTVKRFSHRISQWILGRGTEIEIMLDIREKAKKKMSAELEEELAKVLNPTLKGLQELDEFLEALKKLAFTSPYVFSENNNMLHLPPGISLGLVQATIAAAQQICPLHLMFTLDTKDFFIPRLQNLEVLLIQLYKYVIVSQLMCDKMEER